MWLLYVPGAVGLALWLLSQTHKKSLTPSQSAVFDKAMKSTDTAAVAKVADVFAGEGFHGHARVLRRRARVRGRPSPVQRAHTTAFRSAIARPSPPMAKAMAQGGLTNSAKFLAQHADASKRADAVAPVADSGGGGGGGSAAQEQAPSDEAPQEVPADVIDDAAPQAEEVDVTPDDGSGLPDDVPDQGEEEGDE